MTQLRGTKSQGFSLVEMAIVIVIFGLLLATFLMPLQARRNVALQLQTDVALDSARQALLGFAQTNGRLPCPATAASNGVEAPLGGGLCTQQAGFLPAATLGIQPTDSQGYAIDAWNNRVRYALTQVNTAGGATTPDFTTAGEMGNVGISALLPDLKVVCGTITTPDCTAGTNLTANAVAIIFSTGANFSLSSGVDETANLAATTTFYSRTPSAATVAPSNEFDDMVVWISPYVLYNAMIQAGQLH